MMTLGLVAAGAYMLGSIPFGLLIVRAGGGGDVRSIGSGNIGATNVLRTGRKDLAALTLLTDAGKGAVAVLAARWVGEQMAGGPSHAAEVVAAIAGGFAFLGHLFPVWLKFKGGKGVATFYGVLFAAAWPVGVVAAVAWLLTAALLRFSSLAALVAAAAAPIAAFFLAPMPIFVLALFMGALILVRHHQNIGRLLKGTEPRIGAKSA
jgi:glycerol-3-phosphate acyltransferase PlsY